MSKRNAVLAVLVVSLFAMYACKSVETTSAMLHNEHGNYDKAIEMAKLAIEKNANDAEAHFQLGVSYSFTGDMTGAYREFTTAGSLDPKKLADAETNIKSNWAKHFNSGLSEFQTDNLAGASHEFEQATKADPRAIKGWLNLTKVAYAIAREDSTQYGLLYASVDTLLARAKEDDEDYGNVLALAGQVQVKRGMKEEATKIFEKLLLEDAANFEDVERAGNEYLIEKDWENAALLLQMAIEARKKTGAEDFESYYNLGVAYFNAKDCPKAVDAYINATTIDPENKQGQYSLLLTYYTCEMYDDAIVLGQQYTGKWPEDPNGWRILSLSYNKKGMKLKAEEAFQKFNELSQ